MAALTVTAAVAPAQAATLGRWKVSTTAGLPGQNAVLASVAVTSPANAWAAGLQCAAGNPPCASGQLMIGQWANGTWIPVTLPTLPAMGTYSAQDVTIGASSAANAWAFALDSNANPVALHWDGTAWTQQTLPAWFFHGLYVYQLQTAVFGTKNVWVFNDQGNARFAAFYNGRRWKKVYLGVNSLAVSAVSPRNIWVVGGATSPSAMPRGSRRLSVARLDALAAARPKDVLRHWNGRRWRTIAMPSPALSRHRFLIPTASAAVGTRSLYVDTAVVNTRSNYLDKSQLLHWNGRRWSRVTVPVVGGALSSVIDNHGGVWLDMYLPQYNSTLLAYYRRGRWTVQTPPKDNGARVAVVDLATISGGRSIWGVGGTALSGPTSLGVIIKHGK